MRILKWLLVALLAAHLPVAYWLYQSYQLRKYLYLNDFSHQAAVRESPFQDLRGGIHVHSAAGGHSLGTYAQIILAAKQAGYRYIFITEHPKNPPLFNPIHDPELIVIYGYERDQNGARTLSSPDGKINFLTHFKGVEIPANVSGLELFNIHESSEGKSRWPNWIKFAYNQIFFPGLFFFHLWELQPERVQLWDQSLSGRPLTGIAGSDAHQNTGMILQTASGTEIVSILVDPYLESFRFVTTHVLLGKEDEISDENILKALAQGSAYIAFEKIADPTGFSFHAQSGDAIFPMGSRVKTEVNLIFQSPIPSRFVVVHQGKKYKELEGTRFVLPARSAGFYRIEVYPIHPPRLLKGKPWILSNPIFVE